MEVPRSPGVAVSTLFSIFERVGGILALWGGHRSIVRGSSIGGHDLLARDVFALVEVSRLQFEFQSLGTSAV